MPVDGWGVAVSPSPLRAFLSLSHSHLHLARSVVIVTVTTSATAPRRAAVRPRQRRRHHGADGRADGRRRLGGSRRHGQGGITLECGVALSFAGGAGGGRRGPRAAAALRHVVAKDCDGVRCVTRWAWPGTEWAAGQCVHDGAASGDGERGRASAAGQRRSVCASVR